MLKNMGAAGHGKTLFVNMVVLFDRQVAVRCYEHESLPGCLSRASGEQHVKIF